LRLSLFTPPIFSGGWERNRFSSAAENRSGVGFDPVRPGFQQLLTGKEQIGANK
jgi:hypothetical protein